MVILELSVASVSTFDTSPSLPDPLRLYTNDAIEVGMRGLNHTDFSISNLYVNEEQNSDTQVEQNRCTSVDWDPWKSTNATGAPLKSRKPRRSGGDAVIRHPSTAVKGGHLSQGRRFKSTSSLKLAWKSSSAVVCNINTHTHTHCVSRSVQGCVFSQATTTLITSDLAAETSLYTLPPFPEQPRTLPCSLSLHCPQMCVYIYICGAKSHGTHLTVAENAYLYSTQCYLSLAFHAPPPTARFHKFLNAFSFRFMSYPPLLHQIMFLPALAPLLLPFKVRATQTSDRCCLK